MQYMIDLYKNNIKEGNTTFNTERRFAECIQLIIDTTLNEGIAGQARNDGFPHLRSLPNEEVLTTCTTILPSLENKSVCGNLNVSILLIRIKILLLHFIISNNRSTHYIIIHDSTIFSAYIFIILINYFLPARQGAKHLYD